MNSKAVLLFILSLLSLSLCGRCPKRSRKMINFNKILRQTDCVLCACAACAIRLSPSAGSGAGRTATAAPRRTSATWWWRWQKKTFQRRRNKFWICRFPTYVVYIFFCLKSFYEHVSLKPCTPKYYPPKKGKKKCQNLIISFMATGCAPAPRTAG